MKDRKISFRVEHELEKKWLTQCRKRNTTLTDFIISTMEEKVGKGEQKLITDFVEKQGNIFAKIENNINQVARMVNTQKGISTTQLDSFQRQLQEVINLKEQQNDIFRDVYRILANG